MGWQELVDLSRELTRRLNKRITPRMVENILVAAAEPKSIWQILAWADVAQNIAEEIVKELENLGLLVIEGGVIGLTEKGKEVIGDRGFFDWRCEHCMGRGVKIIDEIAQDFFRIAENRPKALHEFDQGYVTPETTLARVAYMDMRGDVRGKDLLILGDDDLVSIALGLTGFANRIVVLEIDKRLTDFISRVSSEYGLDIEITQFDLRKPLPKEYLGAFDTFETDPVEATLGFKMFVARGIAALRGAGCAGYFGLTRIESSLEKWAKHQQIILQLGAVITDIIPKFSWYVNWDYYANTVGWQKMPEEARVAPKKEWYNSAWYRIEVLERIIWNEEVIEDPYYDDETSTI